MKHTLSVLVENEFGVLARVASLFSARGFNIESLCVAETLDPSLSLMTIVTRGDEMIMEQITKQLNKLINVIKVTNLSERKFVDRELVMIKMKATRTNRAEILRISDIFRGKVVDVSHKTLTIEVTGDEGKINAMIELLKPLGIKEVARTGKIAMLRGTQ